MELGISRAFIDDEVLHVFADALPADRQGDALTAVALCPKAALATGD